MHDSPPGCLSQLQEQIVLLQKTVESLSQQITEQLQQITHLNTELGQVHTEVNQLRTDLTQVRKMVRNINQAQIKPIPDLFQYRNILYVYAKYLGKRKHVDDYCLKLIDHLEQTDFYLKDPSLLDQIRQRIITKTVTPQDCAIIKAIMKKHAEMFPVVNPLVDELGQPNKILQDLETELHVKCSVQFIPVEPYGRCIVHISSIYPKHREQKILDKFKEMQINARQGYNESDPADWYYTQYVVYDC